MYDSACLGAQGRRTEATIPLRITPSVGAMRNASPALVAKRRERSLARGTQARRRRRIRRACTLEYSNDEGANSRIEVSLPLTASPHPTNHLGGA